MQLEIHETNDHAVRLQLYKGEGSDSIVVRAVDAAGQPWVGNNLIEFRPDGSIYRFMRVNPKLGLQLDSIGQIVTI